MITPADIKKDALEKEECGIPATYAVYNNIVPIVDSLLDEYGYSGTMDERRHLLYFVDGITPRYPLKVSDIDMACRMKNSLKEATEMCANPAINWEDIMKCVEVRASGIPNKEKLLKYVIPVWEVYHNN